MAKSFADQRLVFALIREVGPSCPPVVLYETRKLLPLNSLRFGATVLCCSSDCLPGAARKAAQREFDNFIYCHSEESRVVARSRFRVPVRRRVRYSRRMEMTLRRMSSAALIAFFCFCASATAQSLPTGVEKKNHSD